MSQYVGIDVAKKTLMSWVEDRAFEFKNTKTEIRRFLKSLPSGSVIGVETTSEYPRRLRQVSFGAQGAG